EDRLRRSRGARRGSGCAIGFWRSVGGRPIKAPMITVRQTTQSGHVVDVLEVPAGSGLLEPSADQVLGRALHHPAADRSPGLKKLFAASSSAPRPSTAVG